MPQYRIKRDDDVLAQGASRNLLEATRRAMEIKAEESALADDYVIEELKSGAWQRRVTVHRAAGAR
ncbi:hypothetical protein [Aeromicrobium alkaliterrae]|uniref:DUF2188 domain-containing protein n=1 Tax=Aeromicrobium alkaliterrae TaxID=302168 RepID=A0ABN2JZR8_9ACTN